MLVEDGLLSLDETLGDIFPDDAAWAEVTDGSNDFRKGVTIEELLTLTSGLFDTVEMLIFSGPEPGGQSLQGSFSYALLGVKGEFAYLAASQIHSYIIKERTGMTPRQYLAEHLMGKLGIGEDEYDWNQTGDGIEFGVFGLMLTPMQMAKFGQLYLQGGRTNPSNDERLISEKWIDASFTHHSTINFSLSFGEERLEGKPYGYFFAGLEHPSGSTVYCALGFGGNQICVDRDHSRVLIVQRDISGEFPVEFKYLDLIVDNTVSFRAHNGGLSGISSTVESRAE